MTANRCYLLVFFLLSAASVCFFRPDIALWAGLRQKAEARDKVRSFRKQGRLAAALTKLAEKRRSLILSSDMPKSVFLALSLVSCAAGFAAGKLIYRSLLISVSVAVAASFLPLLFLSLRQNRTVSARLEKLCSSMMILSNSYLVTDDFITSVSENVEILEYPEPFRDFLTYVTLMDSDIRSGLRRLEQQVRNAYFSQWIDALILAQEDRSLKAVTVAVTDSLHDAIRAQQDSDAAMFAVWRDYLLTLILIFSVPLVFKIMMNEAYLTMTGSPVGQGLFVLLLAAVVYSVIRAVKINRPIVS